MLVHQTFEFLEAFDGGHAALLDLQDPLLDGLGLRNVAAHHHVSFGRLRKQVFKGRETASRYAGRLLGPLLPHLRKLRQFLAEVGELPELRTDDGIGGIGGELAEVIEEKFDGLALLAILAHFGEQLHPIFERALRRILHGGVHGALGKRIQVVHGLDAEELHGPLEHADLRSDDDLVERQVVLHQRTVLVEDDAAPAGVERGEDVVLGQVDGELDELLVEFLDGLVGILIEGILERDGHVGVEEVDMAVALVFGAAQIDGVAMGDGLELLDLIFEFAVLGVILVEISFLDQNFLGLDMGGLEQSERELISLHFVHEVVQHVYLL